jgi:signal transduction histidine kinase
MSPGRRRRRHAPPWWPEGESWPPRDPGRHWRRRRARFLGRVGLFLGAVWALSAIGAMTILSHIARRAGSPWMAGGASPLVAALVVACAAAALLVVLRRIGSPVGNLVGAAHQIAEGDFTARVPEHGPPAVRVVAAAFNDMAERLARQERQRRELMADIAHELRTPLSIVQGRIEGLIDGVYSRDASQLEPLLDETRLLGRLVDDLRTLANAESGVLTLEREPTDIEMLMHDAASAVGDEAAARQSRVTVDAAEVPPVNVDPVRMRQVLVNLLANALRHSGAGTAVKAEGRIKDGTLVVRVTDTGPGIPADELPRVFDRFYKGARSSGSGLGLTIARSLVRAHGGDIRAESQPGAGTTITFSVPL